MNAIRSGATIIRRALILGSLHRVTTSQLHTITNAGLPKKSLCSSVEFSSSAAAKPGKSKMEIASYDEVKDLPNHPEKVLIDVREPDELKQTGQIPTSINIPLAKLEDALDMTEEEFKAKFSRDKPKKSQELIFHCKMGGRAAKGAELAISNGYTNVKNYKGSWTEWAQKEGLN